MDWLNWEILLISNVLIFVGAQIFIKKIADRISNAQGVFLQFLICAGIVSLYGLATGNFRSSDAMFFIGIVGFFNAFGAYSQWRAMKLNASRTLLFRPLANVIAIGLAGIILVEFKEWNTSLAVGTIACFFAVFLFASSTKDEESKKKGKWSWFIFVIIMIVTMGIATFLMKDFSSSIPREQFLIYWYIGAFLATIPILWFEKQNPFKFPGKIVFLVPFLSCLILGFLATQYWAFELTLASRVLPFQIVGITFLPIPIIWLLFPKERRNLSKREILAFLIGVIGNILIILS